MSGPQPWPPSDGSAHEATEYLARLRAEFPHYGIVADVRQGVWIAVRGRHVIISAEDGFRLREYLQEMSQRMRAQRLRRSAGGQYRSVDDRRDLGRF